MVDKQEEVKKDKSAQSVYEKGKQWCVKTENWLKNKYKEIKNIISTKVNLLAEKKAKSKLSKNDVIISYFVIKGKSINWQGTIIPIRNVSMIYRSRVVTPSFPIASVVLFIVGLLILRTSNISAVFSKQMNGLTGDSFFELMGGNPYGLLNEMLSGVSFVFAFWGFICAAVAILIIANWIIKKKAAEKSRRLNILLNAGNTFSLVFVDETFLHKTIDRLEKIIENDSEGENITFNIEQGYFTDNTIVGDVFINDNAPLLAELSSIKEKLNSTDELYTAIEELLQAVKKNEKESVRNTIIKWGGVLLSGTLSSMASTGLIETIKQIIETIKK